MDNKTLNKIISETVPSVSSRVSKSNFLVLVEKGEKVAPLRIEKNDSTESKIIVYGTKEHKIFEKEIVTVKNKDLTKEINEIILNIAINDGFTPYKSFRSTKYLEEYRIAKDFSYTICSSKIKEELLAKRQGFDYDKVFDKSEQTILFNVRKGKDTNILATITFDVKALYKSDISFLSNVDIKEVIALPALNPLFNKGKIDKFVSSYKKSNVDLSNLINVE